MDRRGFIQLFAGLSMSTLLPAQGWSQPDHIIVIGGGIVGMSIAYHLARRGARVVVCEKVKPGNGATGKSFAWINASFRKQPQAYYQLNLLGVFGWRRLQHDLRGTLPIQLGGSVKWTGPGEAADRLRQDVHKHEAWGYGTYLVDEAKFHQILPEVEPGPFGVAAFSEYEGTLDPLTALAAISKAAESAGAKLVYPCEVTGFEVRSGRISNVQTSEGPFAADVVVLAAGVDSSALAMKLSMKIPLVPSPGVLVHTPPLPSLLERVALPPEWEIKQDPDGRIVTGSGFEGSPVTDTSREYGRQLLSKAAQFIPSLDRASIDQVTLGWRVLPRDGYPIVGFTEQCHNLYVAAMHSGVTLSPLIGELAASEILDGVKVDLLQPYRPSRFADSN
jgi:glycine/D-amino acid oxidase-like deaminating enzyme